MIRITQIKEIQRRKRNSKTVQEVKLIGQEVSEVFGLTVQQTLDLLNGRYDKELKILQKVKVDPEGSATYKLENGLVVILGAPKKPKKTQKWACNRQDLFNATEGCKGTIISGIGGGIKCDTCQGWFCY